MSHFETLLALLCPPPAWQPRTPGEERGHQHKCARDDMTVRAGVSVSQEDICVRKPSLQGFQRHAQVFLGTGGQCCVCMRSIMMRERYTFAPRTRSGAAAGAASSQAANAVADSSGGSCEAVSRRCEQAADGLHGLRILEGLQAPASVCVHGHLEDTDSVQNENLSFRPQAGLQINARVAMQAPGPGGVFEHNRVARASHRRAPSTTALLAASGSGQGSALELRWMLGLGF